MAATPLISVCMVTYQHEKYVGDAVRSVVAQSFKDFELVIVNDGSTDRTAVRIADFDDPRIVSIDQENQGPAVATNVAIAAARGKYVALFSGDDVCHPHRLRIQLDACAKGPRRLLFSGVDFIDDEGQTLSGDHFAAAWFDGELLARAQVLARLFHRGNFLNGVTTFAEREVFLAAPYDPTLLQLQDFDLWIRLVKDCDVLVLPEKLVSYRIRSGGNNLSAPSADAVVRCANEHFLILRRFFDALPIDLFKEAFADSIIRPDCADGLEYQCEQALLCSRSIIPMARAVGLEKLHALLNNPEGADVLARHYQITPIQFFELMRSQDVFNLYGNHLSTLFLDTGDGFVAGQEVRVPIRPIAGEFNLCFDLPPIPGLQALRWDPIEGRTCRVQIESLTYTDNDDFVHVVEHEQLSWNGFESLSGAIEFETIDPSVWWPINATVKQVHVKGHWEFDQLPETVSDLRRQVQELQTTLENTRMTPTGATLKLARRIMSRLKAG